MKLSQLTTAIEFFDAIAQKAQELPFELLPAKPVTGDKTKLVAGYKLPELKSLTTGEELVFAEYRENYYPEDPSEAKVFIGQIVVATILLQFRYDTSWTLGQTQSLLASQVEELFSFFMAERNPERVEVEPAAEVPQEEAPKAKKRRSTTPESSGDSNSTSPETSDSPTSALVPALSAP